MVAFHPREVAAEPGPPPEVELAALVLRARAGDQQAQAELVARLDIGLVKAGESGGGPIGHEQGIEVVFIAV